MFQIAQDSVDLDGVLCVKIKKLTRCNTQKLANVEYAGQGRSGFTAPEGKKFRMWNVEGKQYLPGEKISVMADVTVAAMWEDLPVVYRTITYDANGGSGIMGSERVPVGAFTLPACEYSPQTGLYFKAWRINGVDYAAGATCYEEGDLILTAIWKSETGWYYPMKNAYHTWGYENSWGASCEEYGRYNEGDRNYHIAIDLNSDFDPNIYACYHGVVKKTGWNGANGNYVILEHQIGGKTIYSFYSHLSEISAADGTVVSGWDKIGVVGKTGSAAGEEIHVHFALVDSYSSNGGYWGYATGFSGDITNYGGMTFYNPVYVIENGKLPTYDPFVGRTIRYNISDAKVSQNASAGDLPASPEKVVAGEAYYLNIQIDNGTALDKVELYMTAPGESEVKIQTDQGPIRYCYSDSKYVFSKEGTYTFRWVLYIGDDTKIVTDTVLVEDETVAVTEVVLSQTDISLAVGSDTTLIATVFPENAADAVVSWSSSVPSVATVNADGKVTANSEGVAIVTATAGRKTAACTVTVFDKAEENLPVIQIADVYRSPGQIAEVEVVLKNNPGITSMLINVAYDDSIMTLTEAVSGTLLGNNTFHNLERNPAVLCWLNDTATSNFEDDGTLVTLRFAISPDAPEGTYPVTVSYDRGGIYDKDMNDVTFSVKEGKVTCVTESGTAIQSVLVSDGVVTAIVQGYDPDVMVFCAAYATNGRMVTLSTLALDEPTGEYVFNLDSLQYAYVKVFLLGPDHAPLCKCKIGFPPVS